MVGGLQNKTIAIIQARMQSERLPGKILMPMPIDGDDSLIDQIINLLKKSECISDIFIATSDNSENYGLEIVAQKHSIKLFRGSEDDVLSRFIHIAESFACDTIVRITADNPILDYNLVDKTIKEHFALKADYTRTTGLPIGMNVEVFQSKSLLKLKTMKCSAQDKEHVTPKFRQDCLFNSKNIEMAGLTNKNVRLTIDYPEDYLVLSAIYQIADKYKLEIGLDCIKFVEKEYPWLLTINQNKAQKKIYSDLKEELNDAIVVLKNLDFHNTVNHLKSQQA